MNSERAEQLLYESEATLRLVDSLLDELQDVKTQLEDSGLGMQALQLAPDAESETDQELPELLSNAATEARTLLESLSRSRKVLERTSQELHARHAETRGEMHSAVELRAGLERALLLVERLGNQDDHFSLQNQLREEIVHLLEGVRAQEVMEQRLSYASGVLHETETQLSTLVQRLSARHSVVLPFRGGWATS